jgi:hypothetical protein
LPVGAALGIVIFCTGMFKDKFHDKYIVELMLISSATIPMVGVFMNLHTQYYLIFVPIWSVLCAVTIDNLFSFIKARVHHSWIQAAILALLLIGLFTPFLSSNIRPENIVRDDLLEEQIDLTRHIISTTDKSQAIAIGWNRCGGYMFNEAVQYNWVPSKNWRFDAKYREALNRKSVSVLIARPEDLAQRFPDDTANMFRDRFTNKGCLWLLKE